MPTGSKVVVVANRLPVDQVTRSDGSVGWERSPGGLVTALEPFIRGRNGAWVGWSGSPGEAPRPFDSDGIHLVPVPLSEDELARYYEGFSNAALWPLYHDAVERPQYHRSWWEHYVEVNQRFADQAAEIAAPDGAVWVHDYQLQLVPQMLRDLRPDLRIGFFLHIPFPPLELFMQLPWRRQIIEGLLGADLIGFQRPQAAENFLQLTKTICDLRPRAGTVVSAGRTVTARAFPISIDAQSFDALARSDDVGTRVAEVRSELGNPGRVILGVDRLDYTKGIGVRLRAFGELLREGKLSAPAAVLVQVATPSRERVKHYVTMREEIERMVGNINGEFGSIASPAIHYLHQSLPREELAALYRAADVMVVTPYRDGMNLVAKEYVASRGDLGGALVLSEFAGTAAEFKQAYLVNPHDINGVKDAMMSALLDPPSDQRRRMRAMRRHLFSHDLDHWARSFFDALGLGDDFPALRVEPGASSEEASAPGGFELGDVAEVRAALSDVSARRPLLVVSDFDGTLSPIVPDPVTAALGDGALDALLALTKLPDVHVGVISGRGYDDLVERVGLHPDLHLIGSHGAEYGGPADVGHHVQRDLLVEELQELITSYEGARLEIKPVSVSVHTRRMSDREAAVELRDATLAGPAVGAGRTVKVGKEVIEIAVVVADKGVALRRLIDQVDAKAVVFLGDDLTDEDAFAALAPHDVGIKVGEGPTGAAYRIGDSADVVAALEHLSAVLTVPGGDAPSRGHRVPQ